MNKINYKTILSLSGILVILVFGVAIIPAKINAQEYGRGSNSTGTGALGGYIVTSPINSNQNYYQTPDKNPSPFIKSIDPNSSNLGVGAKTVTIAGAGFIPTSIVRINGSNRPTVFIDSFHLLVQITGNDTYKYFNNGGFFISVFNGAPGGGYSNAAFFKINNPGVSPAATADAQTGNPIDTSTNFMDVLGTENITSEDANKNDKNNLAANTIFGAKNIYPYGLIQWVFIAILILLLVILARRIYGADKKYYATSLKHS